MDSISSAHTQLIHHCLSITVSSGTDTFTIAFFEVPRVSDNAVRRFQRVRKPRTDVNETIENRPGPHNFRFTIYDSPTEDNAKDNKKQKQGSRSHFLAIKDDKAFAIRMIGDCNESAFKVKVRVGGVNVLQHTTQGKKSQDYFVVCEQKWIWGTQVGKDTARQFRVFPRGREKLSLRYQLRNNNIRKEVEIEITSRRLPDPTGSWSYLPSLSTGMILDDPSLSVTDFSGIMPQQFHHSTPRPSPLYEYFSGRFSYDNMAPAPQVTFQELRFNETDYSEALTSDDPYYSSDSMSAGFMPRPTRLEMFKNGPTPPEAPLYSPTEPGHCSPSPSPPVGDTLLPRPPSPVELLGSEPSTPVSETPGYSRRYATSTFLALRATHCDEESIHSDPEEDMLPHQMVVGTGGLIEQIVCPDKHPEWIDDKTVTLKFKIVDNPRHLPKHLQNLEEPEKIAVGGMRVRETGPGGNYREVPNLPAGTFQALAPIVTDPDGLRRDIRSPMEMELSDDGNRELPESPVDSGEGSVREPEEDRGETDDGGEEGDARGFRKLVEEAQTQPRGFKNKIRMKKKMREQRKRGGAGIMAEKREEPKSERSSRWRRFVDALRRVLTLAR